MPIRIIQQSSKEVINNQELKYQQFKEYFNNTDLKIPEILKLIGFTNDKCAGVRYIRKRMKQDGLSSDKRFQLIRKGDWL